MLSLFSREYTSSQTSDLSTIGKNNAIFECKRQIWRKHIDYENHYCIYHIILSVL